jgi:hypothetical protein
MNALLLPAVFSAASALSAFLLFWSQPLMTKALLPLLGGAPAVWNTAMMFFQTVLLAGYIYAHLLARLSRPWQAGIHGVVLLAGLLVLPIGATAGLVPPANGAPLLWLLGTLAARVGLPFFALSASAPLLQSWFKGTGHASAGDPYFLYAASNIGSLVALLGFPILLEPGLSIEGQGIVWAAGYAALCAVLAACLGRAGRLQALRVVAPPPLEHAWRQRLTWVFLGFVPSSLLLGVTAYVSADLAAVPLLWVVPLALYLLSFIVAFGRWAPKLSALPMPLTAAVSAVCGLLAVNKLALGNGLSLSGMLVVVHFLAFFVVALAGHSALSARRPHPARLTEFYVCLSAGGALGGIFNALIAPLLFSWTYEYEIGLVLACGIRFFLPGARMFRPAQAVVPVLLLVASLAIPRLLATAGVNTVREAASLFSVVVVAALLMLGRSWPVPFLASAAAIFGGLTVSADTGALLIGRSFFGVHRVVTLDDGRAVGFLHGSTLHGIAFVDPAHRHDMLGYYAPQGPIGQIIAARPAARHFGVIGLGSGVLACYEHPGQDWTFYEIDPAVLAIARDTRYFHFLQDCGGPVRVVVGDGRLELKAAGDACYDLLVIDAFSSDSIPMHMVTREAFDLYANRLAPGGLLAMHISNRFLNLRPAIAATAAQAGFNGYGELFRPGAEAEAALVGGSEWVVLARDPANLAPFAADPRWQKLVPDPAFRPWTDAYSNILVAIRHW